MMEVWMGILEGDGIGVGLGRGEKVFGLVWFAMVRYGMG